LAGCKKDRPDSLRSQLEGSWELRTLKGSQIPGIRPDFSPGNGNIWKFTRSDYQKYVNGQLTNSGSYTVVKAKSYSSNVPDVALIFDRDTMLKYHFEINGNTLIIYLLLADGYVAKYVKL
jgi:hypothetical protein